MKEPYPLSVESGQLYAVYADNTFVARFPDIDEAIKAIDTLAKSLEALAEKLKRNPDITCFTIVQLIEVAPGRWGEFPWNGSEKKFEQTLTEK